MKCLFLLAFISFSAFSTCREGLEGKSTIIIENGGKSFRKMMYLNQEHWTMEIHVRTNTLNDTAMLGGNLYIPPGKTGLLLKGDCFMDSLPFIYQPYKATKGRLVVQYYSYGY